MRPTTSRFLAMMLAACLGMTAAAWADPGDATVTVKDMSTGKGVSGVKLAVRTGGARGDYYTGDDGTASIPVGEDAPYVMVQATAEGWAPVQQVWNKRGSEKAPNHFDLVLEKASGISGTLVDQDGKPLPGAKVFCIVEKSYPNGQRLAASWTSATADVDGKWTFAGVPASFDKVELGASDKMCLGAEGYYSLQAFADVASLKNGTAKLTLSRGTVVTISVKDTNGKPVRAARIGYGEDRVASNVLPEEKVNAQGEATLGIAPGTQAVLTVQAKGHAPELVRVAIGDKPQTVNIVLQPGHLLEGNVLDAQGDAAAGATVYVDTWRGARTLNKRLKVDGEGHFSWPEAPDDEVKVDVLTQNGEKRGVVMKAGGDNKVQIQPPTQFKGTVVDAETGKPVETYSVALGLAFQKDQPISWQMGQQSEREVHKEGGTFDVTLRYPYPEQAIRVVADGYLPSDSTRFEMDGKDVAFTFKMEKGKPITGKLAGIDGKPLAGQEVVLVAGGQNIQAQNGRFEEWAMRNSATAKSGADGTFTLPPQRDAYLVAAVTDAGFAEKSQEAFQKDATLSLQPWGKLEGTLKHGTKLVPGSEVMAFIQSEWRNEQTPTPHLSFSYQTKTDAAGHFTFDRVRPGDVTVSEEVMMGRMGYNVNSEKVTVEPNKTAEVLVGGKGRSVIGHVQAPDAFAHSAVQFQNANIQEAQEDDGPPWPLDAFALPVKDRQAWWQKWQESPEGKAAIAKERTRGRRFMQALVKADGSFEAQSVPEGKYTLTIMMTEQKPDEQWNGKLLGIFKKNFAVPAIPGGVSDEPLDIGTLTAEKIYTGAVGEEAQDFTATTSAGEEWTLSKQRGRVVLVYLFSAKADDPANHLADLQALSQAVGTDSHFAMISLDVGSDPASLPKYAKDHHIAWTLGQTPRKSTLSLLEQFCHDGLPAAWVVDANGIIAARDVTPDKAKDAVDAALKKLK